MSTDIYDVYAYENPDEYANDILRDGNFKDYDEAYSFWLNEHPNRPEPCTELNAGDKVTLIFIAILILPVVIFLLSILVEM